MKDVLTSLAWALLYLYVFWAMYVLVMGIYRAHLSNRLGRVTIVLSLPFVLIGFILDVLANITLASLVFLEGPDELLVTDRLKKYIKTDKGWRRDLASAVCESLLDPFDPAGKHCQ